MDRKASDSSIVTVIGINIGKSKLWNQTGTVPKRIGS